MAPPGNGSTTGKSVLPQESTKVAKEPAVLEFPLRFLRLFAADPAFFYSFRSVRIDDGSGLFFCSSVFTVSVAEMTGC
jgi:hypothetical protein